MTEAVKQIPERSDGVSQFFRNQWPGSRIKAALFWSIAILLAAVLLRYSLRGIDWKRVGALLAGARWSYVGFGLVISTISLTLRAYRWRLLPCAEGDVQFRTAFWATAAGHFGNNFLPARYVLTTVLSERVSDAIALVVISATVLIVLPSKPGWFADASKPVTPRPL